MFDSRKEESRIKLNQKIRNYKRLRETTRILRLIFSKTHLHKVQDVYKMYQSESSLCNI